MPHGQGLGPRLLQARLDMSARVGRVVTQTEIGRRLHCTGTTIGRYEKGEKEPTLAVIAKLGAIYSVSPCYLAFGIVADVPPTGRVPSLPLQAASPPAAGSGAGRRRPARG